MSHLNQNIRTFYDQSTPLWLDMWGEHMHHGYYGSDGKTVKGHRQAQFDMITTILDWGRVTTAMRILDAGCGVGGSARILAQRFEAQEVVGLTLSPVQAERAKQYNTQAGLEDRIQIRVQDMLTLQPDTDGPFDLIWSMESAEHIASKPELLNLFYQLLRPGGKLLLATWCHRPPNPALKSSEHALLHKLSRLYHLPPWAAITHYAQWAVDAGFQGVQTDDWSRAVQPFWGAVIRSALSWQGMSGLVRAGWGTLRGAWAMRYMQAGFRRGIIQFGVLQGEKSHTE
ncbi:MAG TPA: class I SAM-dependent methyltransferase [Saprospiraceae bacterium]|nr:class I SAM-dependent methyltransferase [Saprospiraceae bacterium]